MSEFFERGEIILIDLGHHKYIGLVTESSTDGYCKVSWHMKPGDWFHSRASSHGLVRIGIVPLDVEWDLDDTK